MPRNSLRISRAAKVANAAPSALAVVGFDGHALRRRHEWPTEAAVAPRWMEGPGARGVRDGTADTRVRSAAMAIKRSDAPPPARSSVPEQRVGWAAFT